MFVAAKGNSSQSPGSPVIVPNDPPQFKNCIAQVRSQIPTLAKQRDKTIQSDCKQLFTSLSSQVMDFLIRASWYQALAHKLDIKVTNAQIQQAFQTAKKQQFPTATAFQAFLSSSGQTLQDILFRVRVNQIYSKLLARHETTVTSAEIQKYFTTHQSQFGTPEKRNIRIVRTNTQAAAKAAKAALEVRPELGCRRQEVLGRRRDQEDAADCSPASRRARRSRRSTPPASPRRRTRSSGRSTASSATTCSR